MKVKEVLIKTRKLIKKPSNFTANFSEETATRFTFLSALSKVTTSQEYTNTMHYLAKFCPKYHRRDTRALFPDIKEVTHKMVMNLLDAAIKECDE